MSAIKEKTGTRLIKGTLGIIFAIALIVACFLSSIDLLVYVDCPTYFINECEKYNCLEKVGIEKADLEDVSIKMFDYLKGRRESLADITTTIKGEPDVAYFNEKECRHMADCQKLFIGGLNIRTGCLVACAVIALLLFIINKSAISCRTNSQNDCLNESDRNLAGMAIGVRATLTDLAHGMIRGTAAFFIIIAGLGVLIASDFYKYFTMFHLIFFDNDDWLLDETRDRLLMIMPEEFFVDCVKYIAIIFVAMLIVLLTASIIYLKRKPQVRKNK